MSERQTFERIAADEYGRLEARFKQKCAENDQLREALREAYDELGWQSLADLLGDTEHEGVIGRQYGGPDV